MQDFHVVSSYVTSFKGIISNLEFGNFDLNGVMGLGLTGLSYGMVFNTLHI
jgi:hypothetical protein